MRPSPPRSWFIETPALGMHNTFRAMAIPVGAALMAVTALTRLAHLSGRDAALAAAILVHRDAGPGHAQHLPSDGDPGGSGLDGGDGADPSGAPVRTRCGPRRGGLGSSRRRPWACTTPSERWRSRWERP